VTVDLPRHLLDTLEELGYAGHDGLVTVSTDLDAGPKDYVWRDLKIKVGLDAAFFSDGVPLIGFTSEGSPQGLAGIRRRLWNYGSVPVLISASPEGTRAYNATSYSNRHEETEGRLDDPRRDEQLLIASQLGEAFHRADIESGAFAAAYSSAYRNSKRVDAALLNNLRYLRTSASKPGTPLRAAIDALIGGSLTATYLSQRGIITPDYLDSITGYSDIYEALASGQNTARQLFSNLADHFNGDVFGPLPELISTLDEPIFSGVSSLLQGDDLLTGQLSLWPYDFNILPVDLVSSIYEQLLEETRHVNSAYYTPRFLVNMLLDETVEWEGAKLPKIIDLACGSGAFMTEAFRRLCYREQRRAGRELSYDELQDILKKHIFGIDINEVAARTAVFGLYLGLLEQLDPPTIWESAVLPPLLNKNVVVADAFGEHSLSGQWFDIVVGNPPWQSRLTQAAQQFIQKHNLPIADKQAASAFLWLGSQMLRPGGTLGLVMPAKPLLHNRSEKAERFRSEVFGNLEVRIIVDLSAVRRQIFRYATGPAAIIVADTPTQALASAITPGRNEILYVSAHPRPLSGAVDALTITPEEVRGISPKQAESRPEIWATLLWGSIRDIELLDQLRINFPRLEDLANEHAWERGQGYQVGGGDANDATHLSGFPIIPSEAVHPLYVPDIQLEEFRLRYLHRPRKLALFKAPHVLVRRTIVGGRIAAALVEGDAVFANGIIGIAGPSDDRALLATVAAVLSSSLNCYWQFMTSSSWGTERDFVELNEYMSLPIATPSAAQSQEFLELSHQAVGRGVPLAQLDELVFDLYQMGEPDQDRIRNFMLRDFPRFRNPQRWYSSPADSAWLEAYGQVLATALGNAFHGVIVHNTVTLGGDYCTVAITIRDGTTGPEDWSEQGMIAVDQDQIVHARRSGNKRQSTGIFALPAGFFVRHNTVYIVKTADRDRWSRDAALSDADRIFSALAFGE
jgi:hypothetical protein